MKKNSFLGLLFFVLYSTLVYGMGLRSFVALPVEEDGAVLRFQNIYAKDTDVDNLVSSFAYGIDAKQTILLGSS